MLSLTYKHATEQRIVFLSCVELFSNYSNHEILFYISEASRQCGSKDITLSQVSAGSGLLGGSTAMLLTLLGGCCIMVSNCTKPMKEDGRELGSAGISSIRCLLELC